MGFLGVHVGSYVVKNIYDFLKFLSKVEQCSTYEKGGEGNQFGVVEKSYAVPIVFFYLLTVRATPKKH
jgi:hypothetical protein